jgi:hypothetical protein
MVALALVALAIPALGAETPDTARQRRKELDALADRLQHEVVLVREDLAAEGPAPRSGRLTELADGSYYAHADPAIVFEALSPTRIVDARLRDGGRTILLRLAPPSDVRARALRADERHLGESLLVPVDVEAAGGVREAVGVVVYLPGETPSEEDLARCLTRYPEQDERTSLLRCGVPRERR